MTSKLIKKTGQVLLLFLSGFAVIAINGCDSMYFNFTENLKAAKNQHEFVVLTTSNPLSYSKNKNNEISGIDFELLKSFADTYNLKLSFKTLESDDAVIQAMRTGQGDIAAARLHEAGAAAGQLQGPTYEDTHLSLFCSYKFLNTDLNYFDGKTIAIRKIDYTNDIQEVLSYKYPNSRISVYDNENSKDLISSVSSNKNADCAVVENLSGEFWLRYFPSVRKIDSFKESFSNTWLVNSDKSYLIPLMHRWFEQASREQKIISITDKYKAYISYLTPTETFIFLKDIRNELPKFKNLFVHASKKYNLPWEFVAAVSYQESLWNPHARSYTGVRGIMQLTHATADHMGVKDRLNPEQSINGGAKYLKFLLNKTPQKLPTHERISLALASYNIGFAHLKDAQILAASNGLQPNKWKSLREILPMLENPKYSTELQYGPARGNETVEYVDRIMSYYNFLVSLN